MRHFYQFSGRFGGLLAAVLLCVVSGIAASPAAGILKGIVVDSNGLVIAGARVLATNTGNARKTRTTTNNEGAYELSLEEGTYLVKVTCVGFQNNDRDDVIVNADRATTEDFILEPQPPAVVAGLVSDAQGAAVAGAMITAHHVEDGEFYTALTNGDGEYRLLLPFGQYDITVESANFAPSTERGVTVTPGAERVLNITLRVGSVEDLVTIQDMIKPSRPTVANPAEFQPPGVLQIEFGYDGNFRSKETRIKNVAPLKLRLALTERVLLEGALDTFVSQTSEPGRVRHSGVGDLRLDFQVLAAPERASRPALAYAYAIKVPTASVEKGIGTGRVDHKLAILLSKSFGRTSVDLNTAVLFVGRERASGWTTGGLAALAVSHDFRRGLGITGEVSWQSKDFGQPTGVFGLAAVTYRVSPRLVFDWGARVGLSPDAPRVGVFVGFTAALGNPFKR